MSFLIKGDNMKHILNRVIRNLKSINGSSLAEFATTTALMATLAATAAPKLSEMAEGSKQEKTMNEIDNIILSFCHDEFKNILDHLTTRSRC